MMHRDPRAELVAAARRMNALGINQGRSGNVSVRVADGMLITPSGLAYDAMEPENIVALASDGTVIGEGTPSSEWRFHHDILAARPAIGAVVHAHSMFATSLSCLRRGIPAFHYMVAVAGGDSIRCADYATFGTNALSAHAVTALEGRGACLLANHGMIAIGASLAAALDLAVEVETLAGQYWHALQIGEPILLDDAEMARVLDKFSVYGQNAPGDPREEQ